MKPDYEHIYKLNDQSFMTKLVHKPEGRSYKKAWHYHPELEICYTEKSHGQRFVGSDISNYQAGDFVLVGENVPHGFITDRNSYQVVIQMRKEFLGAQFIQQPEMVEINRLFERAIHGIEFFGETQKSSVKLLKKIVKQEGLAKLLTLLELLQLMASSSEYRLICTNVRQAERDRGEMSRINMVLDYMGQNYTGPVKFDEVCAMLNLSKSAFCKFMQRHFHKTFSQLLTEMRLNHAGQLLIHTDKNIKWICYESGFNDLAYFSRTFAKRMGASPSSYRRLHMQGEGFT